MLLPELFAPLAKTMRGDLVVFIQNPERNGSPFHCDIWVCDSLDPQGMWSVASQCLEACGTDTLIKQEDGSRLVRTQDKDAELYFTPLRLVQIDGSESEEDDSTEDYDDISTFKMRPIEKNVGAFLMSRFDRISAELYDLVGQQAGHALLAEEIAKMTRRKNRAFQQTLQTMLQMFQAQNQQLETLNGSSVSSNTQMEDPSTTLANPNVRKPERNKQMQLTPSIRTKGRPVLDKFHEFIAAYVDQMKNRQIPDHLKYPISVGCYHWIPYAADESKGETPCPKTLEDVHELARKLPMRGMLGTVCESAPDLEDFPKHSVTFNKLHTFEPTLWRVLPSGTEKDRRCTYCNKFAKGKLCSRCRGVFYCSRYCRHFDHA